MSELRAVEQESPKTLSLMHEWLRQSEGFVLAGLFQEAETLLTQIWAAVEGRDRTLTNRTAWDMAWLLVRMGRYAGAAEWFSRVGALPVGESALWPAAQQAQVLMCQLLARQALETTSLVRPALGVSAVLPPASTFPTLKVTNLGRFKIARDGQELPNCKARKAIALFRYLLTRPPRGARKDELMDLFWPDARPQDAAHSLHVTVSALRRHLDPPHGSYLLFETDRYMLNPEASIEDDSWLFWKLSEVAEHCWRANDIAGAEQAGARAIALYQGDYYVDSYDLAWALIEQEKLLGRYLTILDRQGQILIALERYEHAIDCYRRVIECDSYRENAHCQLMRCYWLLGRRSEALQQYKRCSTILANELGLEPMPETQALYQRIAMPGSRP
jgi:DNA-binding SARP family transcriptional activator